MSSNLVSSSEYNPKRFGLRYNPPQIVIEYENMSSGKLYHHKIKFKSLNQQSKISELIDDIYKHHSTYLNHKKVSKAQIIQMVEKLREKTSLSAEEKKKKEGKNEEFGNDSDIEYNIKNEDLNSLTVEEVQKKKKEMDKFFDKNNI